MFSIRRYYVFLSDHRPAWLWRKLHVFSYPDPNNLICGGSLLTPFIVQTAAHCVGDPKAPRKDGWIYYKAKNVFENPIFPYLGSNLVSDMVNWLNPREYFVHQRARRLKWGAGDISNDYGYVITTKLADKEFPDIPISYAPVYPVASILKFFDEAVTKEYMCLHIGHGQWNVMERETEDGEDALYWVIPVASDPIRWGWRTIMSMRDCHYYCYTPEDRKHYFLDLARDATWVCHRSVDCSTRVKDFIHHFSHGDSGGPVTCNNVYFSVISGGSNFKQVDIVSISNPIKGTLYHNCAEQRDNMIMFYADRAFTKNPYTQFFPKTQRSTASLVHCNVLLSMITLSNLLS